MAETLFEKLKELVKSYDDTILPTNTAERELFNTRRVSLLWALLYAYGFDDDFQRLHVLDSLPRHPDFVIELLEDLSDLTAHERGQLFTVIRSRWEAWCTIVGGQDVADALLWAANELGVWDISARKGASRDGTLKPVGLKLRPTKPQGRPPAGAKAMSAAERQRRYRERRKAVQAEGAE